jgi:hypothetical protein
MRGLWHRASGLTALTALIAAGMTVAVASDAAPSQAGASTEKITYLETPRGQKPRVVITADPELDDSNSLVRYLLYSADFRTEGLIYASSQFHWKGDGKGTKQLVPGREYTRFGLHLCPCTSYRWAPGERFIDDAVEAYAKAYPNLRVHDKSYPSPEYLKSRIRSGNIDFDGEMTHDTPGSDLIKSLLLDQEESPIYLHAWGGQSTIARALKSIEEQYKGTPQWAAVRAKVIRKAIIHPSGDQDDTYAKYIGPNWPEIRYRQQAGGLMLGYGAQAIVSEADAAYFTAVWTETNVSSRGPLGAFYRVWGDGRQMLKGDIFDYFGIAGTSAEDLRKQGYIVWTPIREKGSFLGEGDTATFLNLIDNGLEGYQGNSFGGWGGYARQGPPLPGMESFGGLDPARPRPRAPTHPFLAAAQRDFANRFLWATTPIYSAANHPPHVTLRGHNLISARRGQEITLSVSTSDPDGNAVAVRWWPWREASTYSGAISLDREQGLTTRFKVPTDANPGDTIHIVAEASDDGTPSLTHYQHIVVTVMRR